MHTLVLSVIGDDRSGLVSALAEVVAEGGGNWEGSHLAELAGKFAGIVVVTVPDERVVTLTAALRPLAGLLEISVHDGRDTVTGPDVGDQRMLIVDLLGNDHPGIIRQLSAVLTHHGISIAQMLTGTREAPMAGGRLFEASITAPLPAAVDLDALRADLERLAHEIQVDITVDSK